MSDEITQSDSVSLEQVAEPKLSVVLNGGSTVLESARIPVQFGVNAVLARIQPTHVLVVIQHKWDRNDPLTQRCGIRKLTPLSQGSDFICFDSAGEHTVTFIALKSEKGGESVRRNFAKYLREEKRGVYEGSIDLQAQPILFGEREDAEYVAAVFTTSVSLPAELFAKKPAERIWEWVNLWHRYQPVDQCDYRKRAFFAFTVKPFVWLAIAVIAKYLWATFASLWLIVGKVVAFVLGWRPKPIFKDFNYVWSWHWSPSSVDWDIIGFSRYESYGVWDFKKKRYFPITGGAILLTALFGVALCLMLVLFLDARQYFHNPALYSPVAVAAILTVLLGMLSWESWAKLHWVGNLYERILAHCGKRVQRRSQDKWSKQKPLYFEWLLKVLSIDRLPDKVYVDTLPAAFKTPVIHRFRLSLNFLKAKMCKPFPRH